MINAIYHCFSLNVLLNTFLGHYIVLIFKIYDI